MVKDGEDKHGLQKVNLKNLRLTLKMREPGHGSLTHRHLVHIEQVNE